MLALTGGRRMVAIVAILAVQASYGLGQTVLIDFGNDTTFRGVTTPGNWNSVAFGYVPNLIDSTGASTTIDWAPDGLGGVDSFNSIIGPTSNPVSAAEIADADAKIDKPALGDLGAAQAAIDYYVSDNGTTGVGRFQIQQVTQGQLYDLTFYGTKQFVAATDTETRFSVFDDAAYSNLLGSVVVTTGTTNDAGNPSATGTIAGIPGPANANTIFYIQWEGVNTSTAGFINSMSLTAVPEPVLPTAAGLAAVALAAALRHRQAR